MDNVLEISVWNEKYIFINRDLVELLLISEKGICNDSAWWNFFIKKSVHCWLNYLIVISSCPIWRTGQKCVAHVIMIDLYSLFNMLYNWIYIGNLLDPHQFTHCCRNATIKMVFLRENFEYVLWKWNYI